MQAHSPPLGSLYLASIRKETRRDIGPRRDRRAACYDVSVHMAAPFPYRALPFVLAALAACSGPSSSPASGPPSSGQPVPDAGSPPSALPDAALDASIPVEAGVTPSEAGGLPTLSAAGLRIDLQATSVSGLSSGAFMAVQFHVAFSSIMEGAAIFAGGPFDCAQGSVDSALTECADPLVALEPNRRS